MHDKLTWDDQYPNTLSMLQSGWIPLLSKDDRTYPLLLKNSSLNSLRLLDNLIMPRSLVSIFIALIIIHEYSELVKSKKMNRNVNYWRIIVALSGTM